MANLAPTTDHPAPRRDDPGMRGALLLLSRRALAGTGTLLREFEVPDDTGGKRPVRVLVQVLDACEPESF